MKIPFYCPNSSAERWGCFYLGVVQQSAKGLTAFGGCLCRGLLLLGGQTFCRLVAMNMFQRRQHGRSTISLQAKCIHLTEKCNDTWPSKNEHSFAATVHLAWRNSSKPSTRRCQVHSRLLLTVPSNPPPGGELHPVQIWLPPPALDPPPCMPPWPP